MSADLNIVNDFLSPGNYYAETFPKNTIYWHHTAGGHRPDYVQDGWERDKAKDGGKLAVGTPYIIGGISTSNPKDVAFDGKIFRVFEDKWWAHHLGTVLPNNKQLNRQSVPIEVTNYGYVTKGPKGFTHYLGGIVPDNMVTELPQPFRGHKFWHRYTDRQLDALGKLTRDIATRYGINLKLGLQQFIASGPAAFEINQAAQKGLPGLWTHTNVIAAGKWDLYPCPRVIELIKSF